MWSIWFIQASGRHYVSCFRSWDMPRTGKCEPKVFSHILRLVCPCGPMYGSNNRDLTWTPPFREWGMSCSLWSQCIISQLGHVWYESVFIHTIFAWRLESFVASWKTDRWSNMSFEPVHCFTIKKHTQPVPKLKDFSRFHHVCLRRAVKVLLPTGSWIWALFHVCFSEVINKPNFEITGTL